jgi:hypothetical protein
MSGLRSLYVLISESMGELEYLQVNIHSPLSFLRFIALFSIYLSILNIYILFIFFCYLAL